MHPLSCANLRASAQVKGRENTEWAGIRRPTRGTILLQLPLQALLNELHQLPSDTVPDSLYLPQDLRCNRLGRLQCVVDRSGHQFYNLFGRRMQFRRQVLITHQKTNGQCADYLYLLIQRLVGAQQTSLPVEYAEFPICNEFALRDDTHVFLPALQEVTEHLYILHKQRP